MIKINNYISEKLHINKDYKSSPDVDFDAVIDMIIDFIDKNYKWDHTRFHLNNVLKSREDHTSVYIRFATNWYTASANEDFKSKLIDYLSKQGIRTHIDYKTGASQTWVEMDIYIE